MQDTPGKIENITFAQGAESTCPPPRGFDQRPGQIVCGNIDMRIDTSGVWHYQDSPINRHALVKLFSTVLRRDLDGDYWLITPAEMAKIQVDDAPFLAVELDRTNDNGVNGLRFRTNVDMWITADANHPIRVIMDPETGEPRPYLQLADDGTEALIIRSVFYELAEHAIEADIKGRKVLCVESNGAQFELGAVS
jgi:hypothetical protein